MVWDEGCPYSWAVICKNTRFHRRENQFVGHKILLGEADSFAVPPPIPARFPARCDDCGKIHCYKFSEVLRFQAEIPESFVPHPLFQRSWDDPSERSGVDNPLARNGQNHMLGRPCRMGIVKAFVALLRLTLAQHPPR